MNEKFFDKLAADVVRAVRESNLNVTVANATGSTALHVMAELATNDYLELYIGNLTDADDFTIKTLNLFALGM